MLSDARHPEERSANDATRDLHPRSSTQVQISRFARDDVLDILLTQLPVGVVFASRNGTFETVNHVARALFDEHQRAYGTREPWITQSEYRYQGLEPINWIVARVLLTGEIVRNEQFQYIGPRDEWRTLSVNATPIKDPHGDVSQALVTFTDVTDVNRAREWEPLIRAISRL